MENLSPTTAPRYKVGIIGLSYIAWQNPIDNHLQAYLENPRCQVVAVCDIDKEKLSRFSSAFPTIAFYQDYHDLLTHDLDIVSVCTPTSTHCKIVCDCAPFVKAIYCEKPMASTLKGCDQIIEACKKSGTILQINHQREFLPPTFKFSRDIIDTGTHVFSLLITMFGSSIRLVGDKVYINDNLTIKLEYIPTMSDHIFQFDCTHNESKMIPNGVNNLVRLLDNQLLNANAMIARQALKMALDYRKYKCQY